MRGLLGGGFGFGCCVWGAFASRAGADQIAGYAGFADIGLGGSDGLTVLDECTQQQRMQQYNQEKYKESGAGVHHGKG